MDKQQQQWYVLRDSRIQGPYTNTQLSRYMLLGRVRKNDRFSRDGESWQSVEAVADLIPEPLKRIDSEQGWQQYLLAKAAIDERGNRDDATDQTEGAADRRQKAHDDLSEFKREWLEFLRDSAPESPSKSKQTLPVALVLFSITVVGIFLLLMQ